MLSILELLFAAMVIIFVLPRGVIVPVSDDIDNEIPTIERVYLPSTLNPDYATTIHAVKKLNRSLTTTGFVIIHLDNAPSLDPTSTLHTLRSLATDFFTSSMDEKLKYNFGPYGNPSGGYTPMGVENVGSTSGDEETGKDLVENYVYRTNPLTSNEDTKTSNRHPRELTDVVGEYFGKMDSLCSILNRMTAMAFGLDLDYFNDFFFPGPNGNSLRIAHYPPQSESSDNRIRYGAHTDYQTFTILSPSPTDDLEGYGGLEVLVGEEWVKVESRGGLVVNAGDLWVDWTGGRWKSGMHREIGRAHV